MWRLAATTGMRRAEIAALSWADVDLEGGLVTLWRDPKTRTSKRTISVDVGTVAAMRAHRARQATERLAAGSLWLESGAVFTMEDGRAVATDYLTPVFGRKVIEAGLPVITLHGLRHAYATMLLRAGEPIRVVSQRIGHATPNITLAVYAHVLPGDDSRAAQRGAALLDQG
jgi:integrase